MPSGLLRKQFYSLLLVLFVSTMIATFVSVASENKRNCRQSPTTFFCIRQSIVRFKIITKRFMTGLDFPFAIPVAAINFKFQSLFVGPKLSFSVL